MCVFVLFEDFDWKYSGFWCFFVKFKFFMSILYVYFEEDENFCLLIVLMECECGVNIILGKWIVFIVEFFV